MRAENARWVRRHVVLAHVVPEVPVGCVRSPAHLLVYPLATGLTVLQRLLQLVPLLARAEGTGPFYNWLALNHVDPYRQAAIKIA